MILLLALFIIVPYGYAANIISANPSSVSLDQGSDRTATIIVDDLPYGLSGFNIRVSLADPSAGEIVGVRYPEWAVLNSTGGVPNASVTISAVDLTNQITPGAKSVVLATITIAGKRTESTDLLISTLKLDGDGGVDLGAAPVQTTQPPGGSATTVPATANHGSYNNGGGGGSYGSAYPATVGTEVHATVVTTTGTAAAGTSTGVPVPAVQTGTNSQDPPGDHVNQRPVTAGTNPQSVIPALPTGIPGWVPAFGGLIVVLAAGGLIYLTYKKKL